MISPLPNCTALICSGLAAKSFMSLKWFFVGDPLLSIEMMRSCLAR